MRPHYWGCLHPLGARLWAHARAHNQWCTLSACNQGSPCMAPVSSGNDASQNICLFLLALIYYNDYITEASFTYRDLLNQHQALHWRHNDHDSVSNHQPHGCLLNRLFRRRSKKTSKLRVTGLCVGNSPGPVNSPHKGPVTRKMFPFDDVIMD